MLSSPWRTGPHPPCLILHATLTETFPVLVRIHPWSVFIPAGTLYSYGEVCKCGRDLKPPCSTRQQGRAVCLGQSALSAVPALSLAHAMGWCCSLWMMGGRSAFARPSVIHSCSRLWWVHRGTDWVSHWVLSLLGLGEMLNYFWKWVIEIIFPIPIGRFPFFQ